MNFNDFPENVVVQVSKGDLLKAFRSSIEELKKTDSETPKDQAISKSNHKTMVKAFKTVMEEMKEEAGDTWFSVKQLSEYTNYKASTIYKYVHENGIPYHKGKGKVMFLKSEIDEWIKTGQSDNAPSDE